MSLDEIVICNLMQLCSVFFYAENWVKFFEGVGQKKYFTK